MLPTTLILTEIAIVLVCLEALSGTPPGGAVDVGMEVEEKLLVFKTPVLEALEEEEEEGEGEGEEEGLEDNVFASNWCVPLQL
jgi:hypothetical protein